MSEYTVGVEEEYQLVDPQTGALRSSGFAVVATDWSGEIRKELQESTIEIGTRVCRTSGQAHADLLRLRMQAATAAAAEELAIAAAGVHPFSGWQEHRRTAGERYERIAEEYGRIARDEHNFGMHIHVAPPAGTDRIVLLNAVRPYIPHLLALSCSSPFFEGEDTRYASYRMVLWRRWPGAAPPPRLRDEREYRDLIELQRRAGVLTDERSVYWMIRLHPEYPTLEFRMCDVCPRAEDAAAIAGLARTLVAAAVERAAPLAAAGSGANGLGEAAHDALLADDCWRVMRHGLDATLLSGRTEPERVRAAVARLLEGLQPVAAVLGEADALTGVARILERGNGAQRLRAAYDAHSDMRALVRWLAAETMRGAGLDRRVDARSVECA